MWGITSRSRTNLRIFRNPCREKSTKERCDNYKKSYVYYVSKKDGQEKKLRNISNLLQIISNVFLISKNPHFLYFQRKRKNWPLLISFHIPKLCTQANNQLANSQIWKEPPSTTGELIPGPPAPLTSLLPLDHAALLWNTP